MSDKTCVLCEHFLLDLGWGGSDVTPGYEAEIKCDKGYWSLVNSDDQEKFRREIEAAKKCPHYKEVI